MAALRIAHPRTPTRLVDVGPCLGIARTRMQWDLMRRIIDVALGAPHPQSREVARLEPR